MLDALEAFADEAALPQAQVFRLSLILDELVTNTISYGFDTPGEHSIGISIETHGDSVQAELVDDGQAFNPLEAASPELGATLEERHIGGLGLRFLRHYANRLEYRRDGQLNRLLLTIDKPPAK